MLAVTLANLNRYYMKKKLLIVLVAVLSSAIASFAQELPIIKGDTLYTTMGFKIVKGQSLKIGTGTMPDGDFKFIRLNSGSLFSYSSWDISQGLANQENALSRGKSGSLMKVVKLQKRGSEKKGFIYYVLLSGFTRYEVDVENAIAVGEIVVADEFKPKTSLTAQQPSAADEIKKYKALLDSGAITRAEYDAKKKQLLGL
jgi:hypothetical protein